jgi:hypothetical protein
VIYGENDGRRAPRAIIFGMTRNAPDIRLPREGGGGFSTS